MIQQLEIKRLRAITLFRLYFVGFLLTFYPISFIAGIPAVFGANTLSSGHAPLHGWRAVGEMLFAPPVLALFFSLFWLVGTWPGLWLFSKFKSTNLSFYTLQPSQALQQPEAGGNVPSIPHF